MTAVKAMRAISAWVGGDGAVVVLWERWWREARGRERWVFIVVVMNVLRCDGVGREVGWFLGVGGGVGDDLQGTKWPFWLLMVMCWKCGCEG